MNAPARQGMTLVEIIAVVVIIGMIAAAVAVAVMPNTEKARRHLAKVSVAKIASKVELYYLEKKELPPTGTGLKALGAPGSQPSAPWFLKPEEMADPWDRPFVYRKPGSAGHPYEILSLGADGRPGGADVDEDISSVGSAATR